VRAEACAKALLELRRDRPLRARRLLDLVASVQVIQTPMACLAIILSQAVRTIRVRVMASVTVADMLTSISVSRNEAVWSTVSAMFVANFGSAAIRMHEIAVHHRRYRAVVTEFRTIGTNSAASADNLSNPARAALRQAHSCCGERPYRRATTDATMPGAKDSATIRPLISSLQRRLIPTWISTRPRGFNAPTICSTKYANLSLKDGSHVAAQRARDKVGAEERLRSFLDRPNWLTLGTGHL
jgi:hypothetical protein